MIALALAGAAIPRTALEAERMVAAIAAREGRWTALRRWAGRDAVILAPRPTIARFVWRGRADPSRGGRWWPTAAFISCDGASAVTIGRWQAPGRPDASFVTVWARDARHRWRWRLTGTGRPVAPLAMARGETERVASCAGRAPVMTGGEMLPGNYVGAGAAADNTLRWIYGVATEGARHLVVRLWNGVAFDTVYEERVAGDAP